MTLKTPGQATLAKHHELKLADARDRDAYWDALAAAAIEAAIQRGEVFTLATLQKECRESYRFGAFQCIRCGVPSTHFTLDGGDSTYVCAEYPGCKEVL